MFEELSDRITIEEMRNGCRISVMPSRNLIIGMFQIIFFLALIGLMKFLITSILNANFQFNLLNVIFSMCLTIMLLIGIIRRLINIADIFLMEEFMVVNHEFLMFGKKGFNIKRRKKILLNQIKEFKIEQEKRSYNKDTSLGFISWSNFLIEYKNNKYRFFDTVHQKDLELITDYLNSKKIGGLKINT